MKKLSAILLLISLPLAGIFISSASQADTIIPGVNSLKQNVIKTFLQKANDPTSQLHQFLTKFNQDHTDGRNSQGVLPKNITATNIQVVPLSGENQFGSYCQQISGKPGQMRCENSVSETYLVSIMYRMGVRKATDYNSLKFMAEVAKQVEWKQDDHGKQYDRNETVKVAEPVPASVQPKQK